jgi:hypothetical protein
MGKKFIVTEEEKKRIKGLYEQPEQPEISNNNEMKIMHDIIMHVTELEFSIYPSNDNQSNDDGAIVTLEYDNPLHDNDLKIKSINNMSDILTDEEVANYVNGLIQNGHFKNLPTVVYYDPSSGDIQKPF